MHSSHGTKTINDELAGRIAVLEAKWEIGQLPARYATAADSRDVERLVELFTPHQRDALRRSYTAGLKEFYRSVHQICGHVIELRADDTARGVVSCRAEHEVAGRWIVAALCYYDDYECVGGTWMFERRNPRLWYACDVLERPQDADFAAWTGSDAPALPGSFASWERFWADHDISEVTTKPDVSVPQELRTYGEHQTRGRASGRMR